MNQTGPWHKLHQSPGHFGYRMTSHLINLPVGCHQKKTLIHYLHPIICGPFAKSLSGLVYLRYQVIRLRHCLERAWGYCVAPFVKINFFYRCLWIILASFDSLTQSSERRIWYELCTPCVRAISLLAKHMKMSWQVELTYKAGMRPWVLPRIWFYEGDIIFLVRWSLTAMC